MKYNIFLKKQLYKYRCIYKKRGAQHPVRLRYRQSLSYLYVVAFYVVGILYFLYCGAILAGYGRECLALAHLVV